MGRLLVYANTLYGLTVVESALPSRLLRRLLEPSVCHGTFIPDPYIKEPTKHVLLVLKQPPVPLNISRNIEHRLGLVTTGQQVSN